MCLSLNTNMSRRKTPSSFENIDNGDVEMEDLKLRKKNLIMFPLGTVGRDMVYSLITNFLLSFILFTRGLNAA